MNSNEIVVVLDTLWKYRDIFNKPSESTRNTVRLKNELLSYYSFGRNIANYTVSYEYIKEQLRNKEYKLDRHLYQDAVKNPLEADRDENKEYWQGVQKGIDFPKFISMPYACLLAVGKLPTLYEFCGIYINTYMESLSNPTIERANIGAKISFGNDCYLINDYLKFKDSLFYDGFIRNLPVNELVTYDICSRIYKVYGSIMRDVYNPFILHKVGLDVYYDLINDFAGIDLIVNGIPFYAYSNTSYGNNFRVQKVKERHKDIDFSKGIQLRQDINRATNDIFLMSETDAIRIRDKICSGNINGIETVTCN